MKKIYSRDRKCLIFIDQKATPDFWDDHWNTEKIALFIRACKDAPLYTRYLKKYLKNKKGIILEGGCGRGEFVHAFKNQGFNAIGIDYAKKTVELINKAVPEIDIRYGDVRNLQFKDNKIEGYCSFGVIEHFWEGYDSIFSEMSRVIMPGGHLFLMFPYMSPLRKFKALLRQYESGENISENTVTNFYQFALNHKKVISDISKFGFVLEEKVTVDGIKGLKDEISFTRKTLQKLYDYNGKNKNNRIILLRGYLDTLFKSFSAHCVLLILKKV